MRADDNWALLHAQQLATRLELPLRVVFALAPSFPGATKRAYHFLLKGLAETAKRLRNDLGIPFHLLRGSVEDVVPEFARRVQAAVVVCENRGLPLSLRTSSHMALRCSLCFHMEPLIQTPD